MSNCTGGAQLPNPVYNLACDITCTNGYYLPIGSTQCSECEQGSFSLGGSLNVYTWDKWPNLNYKTYCTDLNGVILHDLPGWVLNGTWVDSGDYLQDNQNSILEFEATWVRDGIIKFNWRVSAEPTFDGLTFSIDNVVKIPFTSTHLSGFSSFNLTEGTHKFKFVFAKDYSVSFGDDRAFIYELVLEGVDYADSVCTPCPPGKFSNQTATQVCSNCPFGTYNNGTGATSCQTCPPLTYAFEGSTECIPMLPCVDTDYEMKTTECRAGIVMDHIYSWRAPKICDDSQFHLPSNSYNVSCYDCQPGQFRSNGDYVCRSCSPGTYLQGENTCVDCGQGHYAPRLSTYSRWDTWPSGWNFSCDGDLCSDPSWRLNGISVDSGFGHGAYSSPYLYIPLSIEGENTKISISFRFTCTSYCYAGFSTNNAFLGFKTSSNDTDLTTYTFNLTPETTSFEVSFYRYSADNFGTDRFIIRNISIYGDSNGGAIECLKCRDGTSSPGLSSYCSNCPPGSYSVNGTACAQCPANTFSATNGSTTCTPCGHGTFSEMGSTECSTDCTFAPYSNLRLGNDSMIKYNLTALMKNKMWGPVVDTLNYKYFFSICSKDHDNTSCIDQDGKSIRSFACQAVNAFYSVDLGNLLAFHLRPNAPSDMGLVMSITGGDSAGCSRKRELNITFICDPNKGDGQPRPPSTGVIEVGTTCQYNVIWESLYACPVCSERDYSFDIGICYNGFANKTYRWVESPNVKNCHDGVSLPPTEVVACGNLLCNPGQWQPPGSDHCVDVDPGYFSVGAASYYYDWTSLPYEYTLACSSPQCSDWRLQDSVIASGNGESSLFLELTYLSEGTLSFTYRTNAEGASSFSFSVDNNQVFSVNSTQIVYTTKVINVKPGKHVFRWKFTGGVTSSNVTRAVFAKIKTIVALGTKTSSGSQLPCLAGTFSSGGTSACSICPANTFSPAVSSECTDCLPDTYSIPQSSHCLDKPVCTTTDYQQFYTPCDADLKTRISYYLLNQPVICKRPNLPLNRTVECSQEEMVCALGQLSSLSSDKSSFDCQPCPLGTYANNETMTCEGAPAGSYATSVYVAFPDNVLATHPDLPGGFSTGCEGICGSNGWRVITGSDSGSFKQAVDSGYHDKNEVDSFLKYTGTFVEDGSINFVFKVTGDDNVGLEFFIDGVMQTNVWRGSKKRLDEVTYPIKKGDHTFMWLYHQSPNNSGSALVEDIVMMGVEGGSISTPCPPGSISKLPFQPNCALCTPGTYNADYGQTLCKMCSIGEFSWQYGATECLTCSNGKNQQPGMSSCTTDCVYTDPASKQTFNISSLSTTFGPVIDYLSNKQYFINPCFTNQQNKCIDSKGNKISTYVCEVDPTTGYGTSAGQNVAFNTSIDPSTNQPFLTVSYSNGDSTGCEGEDSRSTDVIFVCDTTTANQISFSGTLGCKRAITWRSRLACRVCSTSTNPLLNPDYDVLYGECQPDNKKGAIMYRNATCNGPAVITTARADCTYVAQKGSIPVGAIIIVIVGVSGLLGVIVVVAVKNRRLNHQYTNLLTQSINLDTDTELGKVESHNNNVKTDDEDNI